MQHFYATHPEYKQLNEQVETLLKIHKQQITSAPLKTQRLSGVVTLPVVVHIIHNNGTENISDAQVLQGIQHLNEAFANSGYYDPADGVNTQIQFCMAQRDPANNVTNGITRDVSPYTVMGGANYYSDDLNVKDINRWNPLCYINIWLVKSIPTSVVGYAYLPSAHGSNVDGIIEEAAYFGSSPANDVVIIHETGHYLGLYHTFEGNCTNNDCTTDGDKVCDTPPDQSTAGVSCGTHVNSCTTDALSGFATDQNDLTEDYMDYGNFNCMKVFTQGQSDRMNWFIQNVRQSLLACKSCMNPCPAPVTADFISPAPPFTAGNSYTFTNTSVNAASYEWYVNNVLQSTASNFTYSFPATGSYTIKLIAKSASILCNDAVKTITITVVCGVAAGFTKSAITVAAGTNINFTNTATGADTYEWLVNGVSKSTATNFVYTSSVAGDYLIKLVAKNSTVNCQQEYTDTVHFTCSVIADFTPGITTTLINTPVTFTSTGTGATIYQWMVNGVIAGSAPTFTYTFTAIGAYTLQLIAGNGICSAAKTAIIYTTDKCGNAQYLFQKSYTDDGATNIYNICATSDGGSVMTGLINRGTPAYATILKVDAAGNVQWMNTYADNRQGWFNKIKQTSDGGYIAIGLIIGTGGSNLRIFIVKTLSTGAIEWSREYDAGTNTSIIGTDIIQSTDGTYYFTSALPYGQVQGNSSDALIGKLDATGNINWLKTYDARFSEAASGIAEDKTQLIICGNRSVLNSSEGFLLKLNKTDGSVAWAKTYQSARDIFNSVMVSSDGYYVDGLLGNTITGHLYLKTDFTGKLTYSKYTEPFGAASFSNAASFIKPNGNIISLENPAFTNPAKDFLVQEISPVTGILWTKKYNRSNIGMRSMAIAADNSIWLAGYKLNGVVAGFQAIDAYVMKLDEVGDAGECPAEKTNLELLPLQYTTADADFTAKNYQPQITTSHNITKIDVTVNTVCQHLIKCDSIPVDTCSLCDTLQLSGTDTVCSFTTTGIYSVARRPGCTAIPRWYLSDSTSGTITSVNDSTITIVFKKTGRFVLNSTINTGCKILKDTSGITVLNAPNTINLGPDIQLCKFSSIKL
ncbi:MAG: PKD domain-containing protein, partial [Bacteroidota bacterium]